MLFLFILVVAIAMYVSSGNLTAIRKVEQLVVKEYEDESYIFFSPSRILGEEESYAYQIDSKGKMLKKYYFKDEDFIAYGLNQKFSNYDVGYIKQLANTLPNYYYTYNLLENKFSRNSIDIINEDAGVSSINHYGKDTYITTVASHITGKQFDVDNTENPINSLCNLTKKICIEEDKESYLSNQGIFEFSNGNVLSVRTKNVYLDEEIIGYDTLLILYDENLNVIETKTIAFESVTEDMKVYLSENKIWIVNTNAEGINYHLISENLQIEKSELILMEHKIQFRDRQYYQINETQFLQVVDILDKDNNRSYSLLLFEMNKNGRIEMTTINSNVKIDWYQEMKIHSIDYYENEIIIEAKKNESDEKVILILDSTSMEEISVIPVPKEIDSTRYISNIVKVPPKG